jgi:hypothetical protein
MRLVPFVRTLPGALALLDFVGGTQPVFRADCVVLSRSNVQ